MNEELQRELLKAAAELNLYAGNLLVMNEYFRRGEINLAQLQAHEERTRKANKNLLEVMTRAEAAGFKL
jgi:hypothetical protein